MLFFLEGGLVRGHINQEKEERHGKEDRERGKITTNQENLHASGLVGISNPSCLIYYNLLCFLCAKAHQAESEDIVLTLSLGVSTPILVKFQF